jgi:NADPH-dependent 2,4-dienoyl-CoA reductase/sulfur reductase-like enzyme
VSSSRSARWPRAAAVLPDTERRTVRFTARRRLSPGPRVAQDDPVADAELDAVVVGAGFSGLAVLHLLRSRGLWVRAYDAAGNVGGTWWWHAYPGSRLDTECRLYQYDFSEDLYREWGWSERYPAGYEVQR